MNKFKKRMRCGISLFGLWGCQKNPDVTTLLYVVPATPEEYVADCFSKGFLHFSDKGDYVLDEFGFEHLLSWTPAGTKETKYYTSKDGVANEELSKDKFADGEQIVFGFDSRETYSSAGVTCVWKYSDILLTQWVEVRGKFTGKDLIQFISNRSQNGQYIWIGKEEGNTFTHDFKPSKKKKDTEYIAHAKVTACGGLVYCFFTEAE